MSYAVVWNETATSRIDTALESSPLAHRRLIVNATEALMQRLTDSPMQQGESGGDPTTRVDTYTPVTVHFRVIERVATVRVFAASVYRPRE